MKQYAKRIDGKTVIKTRKQIVVKKNGLQTFNPHRRNDFSRWLGSILSQSLLRRRFCVTPNTKSERILRHTISNAVNEFTVADKAFGWIRPQGQDCY